jgi:hypothetical protein
VLKTIRTSSHFDKAERHNPLLLLHDLFNNVLSIHVILVLNITGGPIL